MTPEAPKRLTLTDAYRDAQHVIDQLTTRSPGEAYATVEFTRNAKEATQINVKISAPLGTNADELNDLAAMVFLQAQDTYNDARAAFPTNGAA